MGLAPIHYACGKGFVEITEELIPLVGVNFRDGVFFFVCFFFLSFNSLSFFSKIYLQSSSQSLIKNMML